MARILHLSDLHLGERSLLGDYKSGIVPASDRDNSQRRLAVTLAALRDRLLEQNQVLDAVVITGDITNAGSETGFQRLAEVLAELGPLLPAPNHIVAVPGNHDVAWGEPPSTSARYEHFLAYLRAAGFVTPYLDGLDLDERGRAVDPDLRRHHIPLADGTLLIPVNSSNYCGVLEPLISMTEDEWRTLADRMRRSTRDASAVRSELNRLRMRDAARVSHQQIIAMANLVRSVTAKPHPTGVRVALMHHHTLPVSTREEVKPFESITNLGLLRAFLRDNHFDCVLHGHKHHEFVYWDHIYRYDERTGEPRNERRVLVVGGAAINDPAPSTAIARLIEIDGNPGAPTVEIRSLLPTDPGSPLEIPSSRKFLLWQGTRLWDAPSGGVHLVSGDDLDITYARLTTLMAVPSSRGTVSNVVCVIASAPDVERLPASYPLPPGVDGPHAHEWMQSMVAWWQRSTTRLGPPYNFTHGARIKQWGHGTGPRINQIDAAVKALRRKETTSRATINLVDPSTDMMDFGIAGGERKFPHFCTLQLHTSRNSDGSLLLHCIAYFRKQEMRFWWPINVVEITRLRNEIAMRLAGATGTVFPGSLVTIAALAYVSPSFPKLLVPLLDRWLDESPERIAELAFAMVVPSAQSAEIWSRWEETLNDLTPPERPDPDGVPVTLEGLEALQSEVEKYARLMGSPVTFEVSERLVSLLAVNREYAGKLAEEAATGIVHERWRRACIQQVQRIRSILDTVIPPP